MSNILKITVVSVLFALLVSACKKKVDEPEPTPIPKDVYMAGNDSYNSNDIAKYWKNGVFTNLSAANTNAYARSIFVYNDNINDHVCVAGYAMDGNNNCSARLWEDGIEKNLGSGNTSSSESQANAVFGGFAVGWQEDPITGITNARLWTNNGTGHNLTDGTRHSSASSIFGKGLDLYVTGNEHVPNKGDKAKIWIYNGINIDLTNGDYRAGGLSIFVSGLDVYVAGYEQNASGKWLAKLWKNGNVTNLTDGNFNAFATSVFVDGENVYVAFHEDAFNGRPIAKLWKNGIITTLSDGNYNATPSSVIVSDGDVYVSDSSQGRYWKNGVEIMLPDCESISSIAAKYY